MSDEVGGTGQTGSSKEVDTLGTCCACGRATLTVRNVYALPFKAPVPGTGWGCVECGLPMDGAQAVVCDECHDAGKRPVKICYGYPKENVRVWLENWSAGVAHLHDETKKHGEES